MLMGEVRPRESGNTPLPVQYTNIRQNEAEQWRSVSGELDFLHTSF